MSSQVYLSSLGDNLSKKAVECSCNRKLMEILFFMVSVLSGKDLPGEACKFFIPILASPTYVWVKAEIELMLKPSKAWKCL